MSTNTIETDTATTPETAAPKPKGRGTVAKKAKPAKKAGQAKKPAGKPTADRTNKKAEVIALLKRAKTMAARLSPSAAWYSLPRPTTTESSAPSTKPQANCCGKRPCHSAETPRPSRINSPAVNMW